MKRDLAIKLLDDTWPNKAVPAAVAGLVAAKRSVSVVEALLHTALWTRPPIARGFELSDMWAWLRYFPAIDGGPGLRLREEWTDVAHQKTILSDELGVGLSTCVLAQHLGLAEFVDTMYVLRVLLPGEFTLSAGATRRGPRKSPDYLARTPNAGVAVLECKGSQSTPAALEKTVRAGIEQKKNLSSAGGHGHRACTRWRVVHSAGA